jgi:molecular chaperone DnaK
VPQIEVAFDIDANGIVNVSAKDKGTGKEQQVRIQASSGLSDEEIEKMVQDAEAHADEDKKRREAAEHRNQAEMLIYTTEKSLGEYGDKVSDEEKKAIEDAVQGLKTALEGEDQTDIQAKTEALGQASMKLGEAMYKAAQEAEAAASGGAGGDGSAAPGDDDTVVDADFQEVEDEPQSEPESEAKPESETKPETEAKPEAEAKTEPEAEAKDDGKNKSA